MVSLMTNLWFPILLGGLYFTTLSNSCGQKTSCGQKNCNRALEAQVMCLVSKRKLLKPVRAFPHSFFSCHSYWKCSREQQPCHTRQVFSVKYCIGDLMCSVLCISAVCENGECCGFWFGQWASPTGRQQPLGRMRENSEEREIKI